MTNEYLLWGGRFRQARDPFIAAFTSSLPFDRRLVRVDVLGSLAHATMLGAAGILPRGDVEAMVAGLRELLAEIEAGTLAIEGAEDIHTFVEAKLQERIGDAARRLHTARSRNDQVATDARLYLRQEIGTLVDLIADLQDRLLDLAARYPEVIIPGYTHLQRAQPVLFAHHLLAYVEMLGRDAQRLRDCHRRTNVLPLGAAALAGTSFPVDPHLVARLLGFEGVAANSMDAVSDRDFALEALAASAVVMVHLSRWAGEIALWATGEFGFVVLPDAVSSGSSIMPQKKNPDPAELVRGKAGRVFGDLMAVLSMMKGLPLAYNSDLQEDKEALFDALDTTSACLRVMVKLTAGLELVPERVGAALRGGYLTATEVADYLVSTGMPFRDAHGLVGRLVLEAQSAGKELWDLSLDDFRRFSDRFGPDVLEVVTPAGAVAAKRSPGGTAPARVREAMARAREEVAGTRRWLASRPGISPALLRDSGVEHSGGEGP